MNWLTTVSVIFRLTVVSVSCLWGACKICESYNKKIMLCSSIYNHIFTSHNIMNCESGDNNSRHEIEICCFQMPNPNWWGGISPHDDGMQMRSILLSMQMAMIAYSSNSKSFYLVTLTKSSFKIVTNIFLTQAHKSTTLCTLFLNILFWLKQLWNI